MWFVGRRGVMTAMLAATLGSAVFSAAQAETLKEVRIDWATYNPVSMLLKSKGLLEKEFAKDGIAIVWVQTLGSNKALEFLNASSIDFGSTAGSAALVAKINGNPIKSIYVYSRPEWTALVTGKDSKIASVADLKGKRVAVTRGTDPHIFLVRALQTAGLSEKDITPVLLQHPDGKAALIRGDVEAWAGLDPMMAQAEIVDGAKLFFRKPEANTWGILNVREAFAKDHPDVVRRVLAVYEEARKDALANYDELKRVFIAITKLPEAVVDKQLKERTELTHSRIGAPQRESILAAGLALQQAGVVPANVDVTATVDALIDDHFITASNYRRFARPGSPPGRSLKHRLPLPSRVTLDYVYSGNVEFRTVAQAARRTTPGRGGTPPAPGLGSARARCARRRLGNHRAPWPVERPSGTPALGDLFYLCRPRRHRGTATPRHRDPVARPRRLCQRRRAGHPRRRHHRLFRTQPPFARSQSAGPARHPLDRLGAAVHFVVRHFRAFQDHPDCRRRLLSRLPRRHGRRAFRRSQDRRGRARLPTVGVGHGVAHSLTCDCTRLCHCAQGRARARLDVRGGGRVHGGLRRPRLFADRRSAAGQARANRRRHRGLCSPRQIDGLDRRQHRGALPALGRRLRVAVRDPHARV